MQSRLCLCLALRGAILAVAYFGLTIAAAATDDGVLWRRQLGTAADDDAYAVATDAAGNVYVAGDTYGALAGTYHGGIDAWVAKYDAEGNRLWARQIGTTGDDDAVGLATDPAGNVYVAGDTDHALAGPIRGDLDAWVAKYDGNGRQLWKRQLGTASSFVGPSAIATDAAGSVYLTGLTNGAVGGPFHGALDAWIAKYDGGGNWQWARQLGTEKVDEAFGVATTVGGSVYLGGSTYGALGGNYRGAIDAWVAKYDANGTQLWKRQLGTEALDVALGVAADAAGNVYLTGFARPCCAQIHGLPPNAAWVAKYNAQGAWQWIRTFGGTATSDYGQGVAIDATGNVYLTGDSYSVPGINHRGAGDVWVAKYDTNGNRLWTKSFGNATGDSAEGVATDPEGSIYVTGSTSGSLGGLHRGGTDAWLVKLSPNQ